jgi:hypothetical protein
MTKLKCYFAHPYTEKDTDEKFSIMNILKERGVEVTDPFEVEEDILAKYGVKEYYENPLYKLGRELWINDLKRIRTTDMILAWIPYPTIGVSKELQYAYLYKKFIQIISPIKHPSFAYVLTHGNQQFEDIKAFDRMRVMRWD